MVEDWDEDMMWISAFSESMAYYHRLRVFYVEAWKEEMQIMSNIG